MASKYARRRESTRFVSPQSSREESHKDMMINLAQDNQESPLADSVTAVAWDFAGKYGRALARQRNVRCIRLLVPIAMFAPRTA
jgi:hypothetical protein